MKWYCADNFYNAIKPVEIERFTESSIWINGRRRSCVSEHEMYFPSWMEAWQYLLARWTRKVESARDELERRAAILEKVKAMKDPEVSDA